jgi:hypothetical protein
MGVICGRSGDGALGAVEATMKPSAFAFAGAVLGSFIIAGCGAESSAPDDSENGGDVGETTETAEALSSSCKLSRAQILGATAGARREAIERGFEWYDDHVPYSQSRSHDGYRTDCSGFVSMCWKTGTSYTTASFIAGAASSALGSYNNLEPADALVYRSGSHGHIVLFLAWNDAAHSAACVLEQASTASDMQFRARSTSSLHASGFRAIRSDDL